MPHHLLTYWPRNAKTVLCCLVFSSKVQKKYADKCKKASKRSRRLEKVNTIYLPNCDFKVICFGIKEKVTLSKSKKVSPQEKFLQTSNNFKIVEKYVQLTKSLQLCRKRPPGRCQDFVVLARGAPVMRAAPHGCTWGHLRHGYAHPEKVDPWRNYTSSLRVLIRSFKKRRSGEMTATHYTSSWIYHKISTIYNLY